MNKKFLDRIYKSDLDLSTTQLYKEWASSYEDELNSNKYVTPRRCADMLMKYCANPRIKVLDLGCGTGLSGEALHARGFHQIDGLDLSSEMLTLAKEKAIYSKLINDDLNTLVKLEKKYDQSKITKKVQKDIGIQRDACKEIIQGVNFNSRQLELMCREMFNHKSKIDLTLRQMEKQVCKFQVTLDELEILFAGLQNKKNNSGKLIINYSSLDQFELLSKKLRK